MFKRLLAVAILLCVSQSVQARLVRTWTYQDIAKESGVITVGRVVETSVADKTVAARFWGVPILQMRAKVKVLRSFSQPGSTQLQPGQFVYVSYEIIDPAHHGIIGNGPMFAQIKVGDIHIFPLAGVTSDRDDSRLIDEESDTVLLPAVERKLADAKPDSALAFLEREVANVFVHGNAAELLEAAESLALHNNSIDSLFPIISSHVKDDQARWLRIGVAAYTAMGLWSVPGSADPGATRRPTISELGADKPMWSSSQAVLVRKALQHAGTKDLDDRIIMATINEFMSLDSWGAGVTIYSNYLGNSLADKLLTKALAEGRRGALDVAWDVISKKDTSLLPAAMTAALKVIRHRAKPGEDGARRFNGFSTACKLIVSNGDHKAFQSFLDEINYSKKSDREKYRKFWWACGYERYPRVLDIAKIYLDDDSVDYYRRKYSELAASTIDRLTSKSPQRN